MESSLSEWCKVKESLARSNHKPPYFKEGDVWWVCVGMNVGYEVYGKGKNFTRPVLVMKKYNRNSFLGIPLSSKLKNCAYYFPVRLNGRVVSALTSQIRVFSTKRIQNKEGELSLEELNKVKINIVRFIKLPPSLIGGSRGRSQ